MVFIKSTLLPVALCLLQAARLSSAYPTKEVVQLEDPSKKEGGDGGCLEGMHCESKNLNVFEDTSSLWWYNFFTASRSRLFVATSIAWCCWLLLAVGGGVGGGCRGGSGCGSCFARRSFQLWTHHQRPRAKIMRIHADSER